MKQWIALALIALSVNVSTAQTIPAKGAAGHQQQNKPSGEFSMNLIESGRIDPAFPGADMGKVIKAVEKLMTFKKGEFETAAEYTARRNVAITEKNGDGFSLNDTFAFVAPVRKGGEIAYTFDPETGKTRLFFDPDAFDINGVGAPDYETNRRSYVNLDQFELYISPPSVSTRKKFIHGQLFNVDDTHTYRMGVAFNRLPFLTYHRMFAPLEQRYALEFKLDNAIAAKELPALKAMVIMTLASPWVVYDFKGSDSKPEKMDTWSASRTLLTGNLVGVVFYSGITGNIVKALPESFARKLPKTDINTSLLADRQ